MNDAKVMEPQNTHDSLIGAAVLYTILSMHLFLLHHLTVPL